MTSSLLIIGQPSRLRNGLITILESEPNLAPIYIAEDINKGSSILEEQQPHLLILDGIPLKVGGDRQMQAILSKNWAKSLAIVDTRQEAKTARNSGVDLAILRGYSTHTLFSAIKMLLVGEDYPQAGMDFENSHFPRNRHRPAPDFVLM